MSSQINVAAEFVRASPSQSWSRLKADCASALAGGRAAPASSSSLAKSSSSSEWTSISIRSMSETVKLPPASSSSKMRAVRQGAAQSWVMK